MDSSRSIEIERRAAGVVLTMPTWAVSIVSIVIGAILTASLAFWRDRYDTRHKRMRLEKAICGELLVNHSSLFGTLVTDYDFNRVASHQTPFGGMFTFDALESAKSQSDILYEVPNYAALRTLYKMYHGMTELKGGGQSMEALARDGVSTFETFFAQGHINQRLVLHLSETCAPNLKSRLEGLRDGQITPGA